MPMVIADEGFRSLRVAQLVDIQIAAVLQKYYSPDFRHRLSP